MYLLERSDRLKGGEEDEDIFPSSYPILGSSSTDIITVDDEEETPKQQIIPPRSTDIRLRPNWKEENRKKEEEEKRRKGVLGGQALSKKKEEDQKRILAEHLKKMKLEVEDRERIRCINDQKKRILRLMETEAENIAY